MATSRHSTCGCATSPRRASTSSDPEAPTEAGRVLIVPITSNADLEPVAAHRVALERDDDDFVQTGLWKSPSYICPLMTRYVRRSDLINRRGYLGGFYEEFFVETLSIEAVKAKVRASIATNSQ